MTYTQFLKIAKRKGLVLWLRSGIVERIETRSGGLFAVNPISGAAHQINTKRMGKLRREWLCEELELETSFIRVGDLYNAIVNGSPLKITKIS